MIPFRLKFEYFLTCLLLLPLAVSGQFHLNQNTDTLKFGDATVGQVKTVSIIFSEYGYHRAGIPFQLRIEIVEEDRDTLISIVSDTFALTTGPTTHTFNLHLQPVQNMLHTATLYFSTYFGSDKRRDVSGACILQFQGKYSEAYYAPTQNKSEEALKQALSTLLANGYTGLSYNAARDAMYSSLDNVGGEVECVYTGAKAAFNSRAGATSNGFDCEHTFPQGFFNQVLPERSDIHHLFPTTSASNNKRGNDPFGVVSNPSWSVGGSKWSSGVFEPRDPQKGRTARAMLYFVLRYRDYNNFLAPQESILRNWHLTHLPTVSEKQRNSGIYALQKNRNPLVDYPRMIDRITSVAGTSVAPVRRLIRNHVSDTSTIYRVDSLTAELEQHKPERYYPIINMGNSPVSVTDFNVYRRNGKWVTNIKLSDTIISPGGFIELQEYLTGIDGGAEYVDDSIVIRTNATNHPVLTYVLKGVRDQGSSVEEYGKSPFTVFPNPADEKIRINGKGIIGHQRLTDINGKILFQEYTNAREISVAGLPAGLYFLALETGEEIFRHRIVIVHP
jgi:hypothetical protein